jgi:hypothetical protein
MPPKREYQRRPDDCVSIERSLLSIALMNAPFVRMEEGVSTLNDATLAFVKQQVNAGIVSAKSSAVQFKPYTCQTPDGRSALSSFLRPLKNGTAPKYNADPSKEAGTLPMMKESKVSLTCTSAKQSDLPVLWHLAKTNPLTSLHKSVDMEDVIKRVINLNQSQSSCTILVHAYYGTGKSSVAWLVVQVLKKLGLCHEMDVVNCGDSNALDSMIDGRPYRIETVDDLYCYLDTLFDQVRSPPLTSQYLQSLTFHCSVGGSRRYPDQVQRDRPLAQAPRGLHLRPRKQDDR